MRKMMYKSIPLALALAIGLQGPMLRAQNWAPAAADYEYNTGPDKTTPMGQEILGLYASQPEPKFLSDNLTAAQKFRFTFGSMMLRANFFPNSTKIFAIGQDAVDDAELVKLPGTGTGYSTRVQIIANFFGIHTSLATSNASFQTIKGQYGSFDHPYVELDEKGVAQIRQSKFIDNHLWTMFNGPTSSLRVHREKVWEWMLKNNPESLRLMILFGAASHDAFAEFLISRGARVGTRMSADRLKNIQVPESKLVYAGGNNEFPVLQTKDGKDLYRELLGREIDYQNKARKPLGQTDADLAVKELIKAGPRAIEMMAFTGGGLNGSGILNPAQLGGYDLTKVEFLIDGKWQPVKTLKGLKLLDGSVVKSDIAFIASPHPTSLGKNIAQAAQTITRLFAVLKTIPGWEMPVDTDKTGKPLVNKFKSLIPFEYGRAELPKRVVPFGAPESIRLPVSSADRLGPQVLVSEPPSREELKAAGFRSLADIFDAKELEAAKKVQPAQPLNPNDVWSVRPRQSKTFDLYDSGPGEEIAKLMFSLLDRSILEPKAGKKVTKKVGNEIVDVTLLTHGISAYNIKSHSTLGFFGHYRGTWTEPRALVLHDPFDLEDRNNFRAATGKRGQFLNGLMQDLGIGNNHLVIKTVPVDMMGATASEWEVVRKKTEAYREALIEKALSTGKVEVIFADGPVAKAEIERISAKLGIDLPVVNVERKATDASAGIKTAGAEAQKLGFKGSISGKMAAIAPEHLTWLARSWEGNGGSHVVEAKGVFKGKVYAIVAPNYVAEQEVKPMPETLRSIEESKSFWEKAGVRGPKEEIRKFLSRSGRSGSFLPLAMQPKLNPKVVIPNRATIRGIFAEPLMPPRSEGRGAARSCKAVFGF